MSRRSTPSSNFAKLLLSDTEVMLSARGIQRPTAPSSSSRPPPRPSSTARTSRSKTAPPPSRPNNNNGDDDNNNHNESDSDSDDHSDSSDELVQQRRRRTIYQILSAFDPGWSSPRELETANASSPIATIAQTSAQHKALQRVMAVGSNAWAAQLAANMQLRFQAAHRDLGINITNSAQGRDVVGTIDYLRALFNAVDKIREDHFQSMAVQRRQQFVNVLLEVLEWIFRNQQDVYASSVRPVFAGAMTQSERRPMGRWISAHGQPLFFLECLGRLDTALLRAEEERIRKLYQILHQYVAQSSENPDLARLQRVATSFYGIWRRASGQ